MFEMIWMAKFSQSWTCWAIQYIFVQAILSMQQLAGIFI